MTVWLDGIHIGIMTNGRFSIEEQYPDASSFPGVEITHVYGQIIDATGNPEPGVVVRFNVACPPKIYDGTMLITTAFVDATTNDNGYFEIDLLKNVPYKVDIQEAGLYMAFITPSNVNIINLFELLSP